MKCYGIRQKILPLHPQYKNIIMGNKALKIFYAVFMALMLAQQVDLIILMDLILLVKRVLLKYLIIKQVNI